MIFFCFRQLPTATVSIHRPPRWVGDGPLLFVGDKSERLNGDIGIGSRRIQQAPRQMSYEEKEAYFRPDYAISIIRLVSPSSAIARHLPPAPSLGRRYAPRLCRRPVRMSGRRCRAWSSRTPGFPGRISGKISFFANTRHLPPVSVVGRSWALRLRRRHVRISGR